MILQEPGLTSREANHHNLSIYIYKEVKKPNGYWTKENCANEALKYNSKGEFYKKNQFAYIISLKNNWLNDICVHMTFFRKSKGYWTKERCFEEALKHKSKGWIILNKIKTGGLGKPM